MQKLHSQLALFGAIDREVIEAKARLDDDPHGETAAADAAVIDMVEGFLPGTTGFGQHGWYPELTSFIRTKATRRRGSEDIDFPDLDQAIFNLTVRPSEDENDEQDPVLARAAYAAVVLAKINTRLRRTVDRDPLAVLDRALINWPRERENDPAEDLKKRIDHISNRQDWVPEVRRAAGNEFAERSRPCFGTLRKVDGQYCAYITTDTHDKTLTVKDIAKIIEPINWNSCCKFFCAMMQSSAPDDFNTPGWSRIVERISGECDKYFLDTSLLFWKEQLDDGSIFINYDVDPARDEEAELVEVDSGYIWVSPLGSTGVRIRTSKLERVNGLSPTATAALSCLMGWGDTGHEMLAGTAREYIKDPTKYPGMKPFRKSPRDATAYKG